MIYPADFEAKIGFSSLRSILTSLCSGDAARALVEKMTFSDSPTVVIPLLNQTSEMVSIISESTDYPHPVYYNVSSSLNQLRTQGTFIEPKSLRQLFKTMLAFKEVRGFFCKNDKESLAPIYPFLSKVFSPLMEFPSLCNLIDRSLDRFDEVADNASDALLKIRTELAVANNAASRAMSRALNRAVAAGIVEQDVTPAIRDGRMVIPVAAGVKRSISGIVHDQSASGKTVFIEPAEVVEASNHVRQLQMEERREVIAVLISIADSIRPYVDDILQSDNILNQLDFITAKARLAIDVGGSLPSFVDNPEIEWFGAVHPILLLSLKSHGKSIVPLNIVLDSNRRFLIVSGPNAGGKSVVLKTVGIVQYMMQCGLLPPLYDNSRMGFFKDIFVDIGDQQSIENDLSTYSSHLKNMKYFIAHSSSKSLLLIDEMGSGTEPMIGSAIAQAVLAKLAVSNCYGIVTTHYQNLKTFADDHQGFVNGAMVYDRQHLRPTFSLSIGNPGSSFALEIARNIGLPADVISEAKEIVGSDYVNLDKYLLDIERDRRYWNNKRLNVKEKEHKLNQLLAKYEDTSADLKTQRSRILADARKEAEEILAGANAKIEATIRQIRDVQAEKKRTKEIRRELADYKKALNDSDESQPEILKPLKHKSRLKIAKISSVQKQEVYTPGVGDYVKMGGSGVTGKVLSISGKYAEVAFGVLRTKVALSKLSRSSKPKESALSQSSGISSATFEGSRRRQLDFCQELDIRGMRADEALQAVAYYLDDAVQFSARRVRILHGTGHGILRTLIREQLKSNPDVEDFFDEDVRFGGAGITIVQLK
ncbi:MAG: Smr/MutS family protein [Muribaculaceae bacterium]|nr:Smr/MutS family protein [Muribaculaceae bacterium]